MIRPTEIEDLAQVASAQSPALSLDEIINSLNGVIRSNNRLVAIASSSMRALQRNQQALMCGLDVDVTDEEGDNL